jgi:alcohol dehydrogenase (cytochrome c)
MKMTRNLLLLIAMISSAAALAAQGQGLDPELLTKPATDSWPTYSGDYSGRRFSSLTQINQTNVNNSGSDRAWTVFQTRSRQPTGDHRR